MSPLPAGARVLIAALAVSPLAQAACALSGTRLLNFGPGSWWNYFLYWAVAPVVARLLATRHERARFSAYVFLSCEAWRGLKIHSPALIAASAGAIAWLQTPAARAAFPRIDPAGVRRRLAGCFS